MASQRSPTAPRTRFELGPAWTNAIAMFVSLRLGLGLLALYLWWAGGLPAPCHFEVARNGWTTIPPLASDGWAFPLVGVWERWDACWYMKIATFGYEGGQNSVSFWPLFPLLAGTVGRILLGAMALGGLVVAGLAYVAAMAGLHRLVERDFDGRVAERTVVLISVFPAAFFFFAPFTESLFLACSVWAILAARERWWALAGVMALFASLTRLQGIVLVLPLAWEFATSMGWVRWPAGRWPGDGASRLGDGAVVLAPVIGFAAFVGFSSVVAGLTPFDAQDVWGGREFHAPWDTTAASWRWIVERADPLQAFNLFALVLFGVLALVGIRRLPIAYSLFAIPQIALLASRIQPTPLTSTGRLLLVIFPVFVVVALVPNRHVRTGWIIVSAMLLGLLAATFLRGEFVA
jgi:hypothetical protein